MLQNDLFQFLKHKLFPHITETSLNLATMIKTDDCIYRADPNFSEKPWHDWAYVDWGEDNGGAIPVHLLTFTQVNFIDTSNALILNDVEVDKSTSCFAVVHMIERKLDHQCKAFGRSKLFFTAEKMLHKNKPVIAMVAVNSISGPCIAVNVDPSSVAVENSGKYCYNFLRPRNTWKAEFLQAMIESFEHNDFM